jgi:hypothetical protein
MLSIRHRSVRLLDLSLQLGALREGAGCIVYAFDALSGVRPKAQATCCTREIADAESA